MRSLHHPAHRAAELPTRRASGSWTSPGTASSTLPSLPSCARVRPYSRRTQPTSALVAPSTVTVSVGMTAVSPDRRAGSWSSSRTPPRTGTGRNAAARTAVASPGCRPPAGGAGSASERFPCAPDRPSLPGAEHSLHRHPLLTVAAVVLELLRHQLVPFPRMPVQAYTQLRMRGRLPTAGCAPLLDDGAPTSIGRASATLPGCGRTCSLARTWATWFCTA